MTVIMSSDAAAGLRADTLEHAEAAFAQSEAAASAEDSTAESILAAEQARNEAMRKLRAVRAPDRLPKRTALDSLTGERFVGFRFLAYAWL